MKWWCVSGGVRNHERESSISPSSIAGEAASSSFTPSSLGPKPANRNRSMSLYVRSPRRVSRCPVRIGWDGGSTRGSSSRATASLTACYVVDDDADSNTLDTENRASIARCIPVSWTSCPSRSNVSLYRSLVIRFPPRYWLPVVIVPIWQSGPQIMQLTQSTWNHSGPRIEVSIMNELNSTRFHFVPHVTTIPVTGNRNIPFEVQILYLVSIVLQIILVQNRLVAKIYFSVPRAPERLEVFEPCFVWFTEE